MPRSFVGPLWLAAASYLPIKLLDIVKRASGIVTRDAMDRQVVGAFEGSLRSTDPRSQADPGHRQRLVVDILRSSTAPAMGSAAGRAVSDPVRVLVPPQLLGRPDRAQHDCLSVQCALSAQLLLTSAAQVALALSLFPSSRLTRRRSRVDVLAGVAILTATAAVLRAELVALLVPLCLQMLALRAATMLDLAVTGAAAAALSLSESQGGRAWLTQQR